MKKEIFSLIVCSLIGLNVHAQNLGPADVSGDIVIVRDLKEQDKEIYNTLKNNGGQSGVISSTVVISDTGEETIIGTVNSKKNSNKGGSAAKQLKPASK